MKLSSNRLFLLTLGTIGMIGAVAPAEAAQRRVLLFSHSTGYRHTSIEPGIAAIQGLGAREKMTIVPSADPAVFTPEGLRGFDAIVFLSTSTDPKKPESEWFQGARRDALQAFVRRGGGVVGIHAASDSHYHWPWYGKMIGGHFAKHPPGTPEGTLKVVNRKHPANRGVAPTMRRVDEWYYFEDYNPEAHVLVTLDPASIGEKDVNPNPVSWAHEFEGGRVFYTAMGHTNETYSDPNFLNHLAGGLRWVMKKR
jgi:type 1 glutamine amidotransferase